MAKSKQFKAYVCNTPMDSCNGTPNKNPNMRKVHMTRKEARDCYIKYLVSKLGYTRLGTSQFKPPDGGPVLLLSKQSHYGLRMKPEGDKGKGRYVKHKDSEAFIA